MAEAIYPVPADFGAAARITPADFERLTAEARDNPDAFWSRELHRLDWMSVPTQMNESSFDEADFGVRRFWDTWRRPPSTHPRSAALSRPSLEREG